MPSGKAVALVLFLVFCASGGLGVIVNEVKPGWYPVPDSVRVGRVVELFFVMGFYGLEVLGLILIRNSVSSSVDEKRFVVGLLLLCLGFAWFHVIT